MRFELSNSTPPHQNRRLQLRMLGFVAMIGVIMFGMAIFQANQQPKKEKAELPGAPPDLYNVDGNEEQPLKEHEFISRPGEQENWQEPPPLAGNPADMDLEKEVDRLETKFDKAILRRVKDNTLGIRREEAEAYYRLLEHAKQVPSKELDRIGATDVLYINLMTQPDRFRGTPITIHGDLWRLYEFEAGPNRFGFKTLYEAWIFTGDSANHPYRVVFTSLPRELEPGDNLRKPVRATGYFFKREGYASSGGMHVAPTLLAHRVIPFRPPEAAPSTEAIVPYMIGLISAVGLAFLVTLISFAISDRRAAHAALMRELNGPRPSFEGLVVPPVPTVEEQMRQLEAREWQAKADEVDEEYHEVSALLHARDRAQHHDQPVAVPATEDELADNRLSSVRAVKSWTSQHGNRNDRPVVVSDPSVESARDESVAESNSKSTEAPTSNGLSKLAAWENEIQQFATQSEPPLTDEQKAAQADLERDRLASEQRLNEELLHQRAELEQEQQDDQAIPDRDEDEDDDSSEQSYDQARRFNRRRRGR